MTKKLQFQKSKVWFSGINDHTKKGIRPEFWKIAKKFKKYVYQHDPIAILANHPVKKV